MVDVLRSEAERVAVVRGVHLAELIHNRVFAHGREIINYVVGAVSHSPKRSTPVCALECRVLFEFEFEYLSSKLHRRLLGVAVGVENIVYKLVVCLIGCRLVSHGVGSAVLAHLNCHTARVGRCSVYAYRQLLCHSYRVVEPPLHTSEVHTVVVGVNLRVWSDRVVRVVVVLHLLACGDVNKPLVLHLQRHCGRSAVVAVLAVPNLHEFVDAEFRHLVELTCRVKIFAYLIDTFLRYVEQEHRVFVLYLVRYVVWVEVVVLALKRVEHHILAVLPALFRDAPYGIVVVPPLSVIDWLASYRGGLHIVPAIYLSRLVVCVHRRGHIHANALDNSLPLCDVAGYRSEHHLQRRAVAVGVARYIQVVNYPVLATAL